MLAGLLSEPGRPRLTWYGPDGERVELSGAVLDNWVSKTVNLLVEEFDTGPGTVVRLDLPAHWRTVVWALAVWRAGGTVQVGDPDLGADLLVTDRPEDEPTSTPVVAVALPALARRWPTSLPAGAIDAAAAVMTYGDQIGWAPPTEQHRTALSGSETITLTHARLLAEAATDGLPPRTRALHLVDPADRTPTALVRLLLGALGTLDSDGSLVLAPITADTARLAAEERTTARW